MTAILRDTDQVPDQHRSTGRVAPTHLVLMLVLFWTIVLATTLVTLWDGFTASPVNLLRPVALGVIVATLSGLIAILLDRLRQESLALRVPVGLVGALAASMVYAVASVPILTPALTLTGGSLGDPISVLRLIASNFWIFAAWSVLYLLLDLSAPGRSFRNMFSNQTSSDSLRGKLAEAEARLTPGHQAYTGLDTKWFWSYQAVFWTVMLVLSVAVLMNYGEDPQEFWRAILVDFTGLLATAAGHYGILRYSTHLDLPHRIAIALVAGVAAAVAYILAGWIAWYQIAPVEIYSAGEPVVTDWAYFVKSAPRNMLINVPFFVGWAGFYLALDSARRMRHQEQQLYSSIMLAQDAQLKMLRLQINPHFLFNTLNAISSLVMDDRNEEADSMLVRLSRFLRFTLEVDPEEIVSLRRELDAQELYLEIERARFDKRLAVSVDVDPDVLDAGIPSLLLQPIVENTIKHGVSNSSRRVEITISARRDGDHLAVDIRDNGEPGTGDGPGGSGVGLRNIRSRLAVIYGDAAYMNAAPSPEGGFHVAIRLPLRTVTTDDTKTRLTGVI